MEGSRESGSGGAGACVALLTTKNVDKALHGASLAHRVGMLLALREEAPQIAVVASNQARIIDQAEALTRSFGFQQLTFVVGFDTLERLFASRYYADMERELEPFFEHHRVLAANRATTSAPEVVTWIGTNAGPFTQRIQVLEIDDYPASLSSTEVRRALAATDDHPALSPAVRRYILEHRLYRS
jgi:nicotinic acid mononucleotide adenylyltransferase